MMRKAAPFALIAFLSFATTALAAWTAPTSAPPNGNIDAPLTTGSAVQTKTGAFGNLQLSSLGTAPSPVTNKLYNIGGTLYFNGSSLGSGASVAGGAGTANYLSKFTGATTLGNSQIYDNGTGVAIGTTPGAGAKLQVYGPSDSYGVYVSGATSGVYASASSGWGGAFVGGGGLYAQNNSSITTYIAYPGSSWGVHTNGNMYVNDILLAATGQWLSTSLGSGGGGYWTGFYYSNCNQIAHIACNPGYTVTQLQHVAWVAAVCGGVNPNIGIQLYCEPK
jgi:hypothetical protein